MTSLIRYNTKTSFALLQVYIAMMEGDELTFESFNEMTGLSDSVYNHEIIKYLLEMIIDLQLSCSLQRFEMEQSNNKTVYKTYFYELISRIYIKCY